MGSIDAQHAPDDCRKGTRERERCGDWSRFKIILCAVKFRRAHFIRVYTHRRVPVLQDDHSFENRSTASPTNTSTRSRTTHADALHTHYIGTSHRITNTIGSSNSWGQRFRRCKEMGRRLGGLTRKMTPHTLSTRQHVEQFFPHR